MPPSYRKPAGPVLVVDKPFTHDVLVATVRNILAARDRTFPASRP